MTEFVEADFIPLEQFSLRWRFVGGRYGYVSADIIARIRPLGSAAAIALASLARQRCEERATFGLTFRSDETPANVRNQLRTLPPTPSTRIVLSWNSETAATTEWDVFTAQWDDFCYPASDDVSIWSPDDVWTLCYRHYEVFQFSGGPDAK